MKYNAVFAIVTAMIKMNENCVMAKCVHF